MGSGVKFTGQARHVIDQRPGEFSEADDIHRKIVNHLLYSGSYRIPRDAFILLDQEAVDELQRYMADYARDHRLTVEVRQELESGDYIVGWWPTDGEVPLV